jgi:hypothetical protein
MGKENSFNMLRLENSRRLARRRIRTMDRVLAELEAETTGCF